MPLPFRRKKKKKDLPKPPSFSNKDDSSFLGPPKAPTKSSRTTELQSPPQTEKLPPPRTISELPGPPRESVPPSIQGPPIYEGPPRQSRTKDISTHSDLPPPPLIPGKDPSTPLFRSEQSSKAPAPLFDNGTITEEILTELRQKQFGSGMKKVPERKAVSISADELTKRHFRDSRQQYIEAGDKHLELKFYDNAATNYACAILCDLIVEGWQKARRTMADLTTGIPSTVMDNAIFDGVRLILEAIRTKNYNFLSRAEQTLKDNTGQLYPEDVAIIEKGLKTARAHFGYG